MNLNLYLNNNKTEKNIIFSFTFFYDVKKINETLKKMVKTK